MAARSRAAVFFARVGAASKMKLRPPAPAATLVSMKRLVLFACFGLAVAFNPAARAAEETFSRAVTADDFSRAGLDLLSPAQRRNLDELVEKYKSGALAAARKSADEALAAKRAAEAEARAAKAEAGAARAEAGAAKAQVGELKQSNISLVARAKAALASASKPEDAPASTTVTGKFTGWNNGSVLALANGQSFRVDGGERYYTPTIENPRVDILPASMGGYWLRFPDLGMQVRVNLVSQ
jgi:hypothetical protein